MKLDILKTDKHLTAVFVLCLIVLGTVIRVRGLGKWCINSDEYFLFQSTSFIHDTGLPKFPSGGYYVRGIALQYLMAFTTWIFPNKELGLRIIPLCFGVLTIPMFFLFCKKFVPLIPAILCSTVLLFSSWHIEFSRFARFYSTFQFIFFLFLYFFYIGNSGNEKKHNLIYCTVAFILNNYLSTYRQWTYFYWYGDRIQQLWCSAFYYLLLYIYSISYIKKRS